MKKIKETGNIILNHGMYLHPGRCADLYFSVCERTPCHC